MRNTAWLRRALHAFDMIYFEGQLQDRGVDIKWFRPQPAKESFLYGQVILPGGPIMLNTVLAHDWVPTKIVLATIHHEALHVLLGEEHSPYFELMEKQLPYYAEVQLLENDLQSRLMQAPRPYVRDVR